MKVTRLLLTVSVVCLLSTASVLAQGRINFANTSATALRIDAGSGPVIIGTASTAQFGIGPASMRVQLFAGLTSSSLAPVLIGTAGNQISVTNTSSTLSAAQGTFPGGSNLALAGYDGSAPVFLQFSARELNGLYYGISPIIQVNLATGLAVATSVFSTTPDSSHWNGLTIYLPEPSALALTGLSLAVMFWRRRKMR